MLRRELQALQTDSSSGRARMAVGRTLRSGLAAMTAALTPPRQRQQAAAEQQGTNEPERQTEKSAPVREVSFLDGPRSPKDSFATATPEKPRRPVPARASDVVAMSASVAAVDPAQERASDVAAMVAQEQHVVGADTPAVDAAVAQESAVVHEGIAQSSKAEDAAVAQESVVVQESMEQILQVLQQMRTEVQESQAAVRAEMAEMRTEVQESQAAVRAEMAEMRAEMQQMRTEVQESQAAVRAEMAEMRAEMQQVRTEVEQRVHEVEASQAQLRAQIVDVEATLEQLAKYKESASAHMQQLKQEQGERILAIEQQLLQPRDEEEKFRGNEIRVVRQEVQQILDEHLRVNEQQFIGREGQLKIVEQHNHGKELEEQAMQELQDEVQMLREEQERLREEQEKLKGNEERGRVEQVKRMAVVEQRLQDLQQEQEQLKGNEERLSIVEQKLGEPGVGPGERERQERLEERLSIVEQQWRNRHARELEEQAKLLQALRDEQERLRDEQEKMKGNEKRICAKIEQYMRASAQLVKEEAIDPWLARFEQDRLRDEQEQSEAVELAEAAKDARKAKPSAALPSLAEMEMFKLKPGEWDCSVCWTRWTQNKSHVFKCMSCTVGISPFTPASVRRALDEERANWRKELAKLGARRTSAELADRLPQEMQVRVSEMPRQKDERDSNDDSDDDDQQRAPEPDWNMECCRVEISAPESLQFRDAFEEGRAQAHADIAFQEGYQHGEKEAEANWEIEREMAESYSSACVTDSMLDEREAVWSAEEETRSSGGNEREAEWRTEEETRSGGGNERGAENGEEEDWRTAQWEPLDFVW